MRSETAIRLLKGVHRTYDHIADDFDRTRQQMWPEFESLRSYLPSSPTILDVGCGNGRLLTVFEKKSFERYLGVDSSRGLLNHARKRYRTSSVRFKEGDILKLPVKSGGYNSVFCLAVLHHIPSRELQRKALEELARATSPEGTVFISVWNLYRWKALPYFVAGFLRSLFTLGNYSWKDLFVPWRRGTTQKRYCHAFTPAELRHLVQDAGLEIVHSFTSRQRRFGNHWVVARPFLAQREKKIWGVPVHRVTLDEAVQTVGQFLKSPQQHRVFTPNPEILLKTRTDTHYRTILARASLNVPDGMGLLWAAYASKGLARHSRFLRLCRGLCGFALLGFYPKALQSAFPARVTGVDLMEALTHRSHQLRAKIFLLGAAPGVAEAVAEKWRFDQIVGTYAGSPRLKDEKAILEKIRASGANLLFVAYGAPQQELWIDRNLSKLPQVKVAMGVGGAFDFFAGIRSRAPLPFRRVEWLWRLLQEPRRVGRILNATVVFPLRVIFGPSPKE